MAAGTTGHQTLSARHRAHDTTSSLTEALGKKMLSRALVPWHLTVVPRASQSPPSAQPVARTGNEGSRCWLQAGLLFHIRSSKALVSLHFLFSSFLVIMGLRHRDQIQNLTCPRNTLCRETTPISHNRGGVAGMTI